MVAPAETALWVAGVFRVRVGDAAPPADSVLGIGAHIHPMTDAAALVTDVNLFAVQQALDQEVPIPDVVGNLGPREGDDDGRGLAYPARLEGRRVVLVDHEFLDFSGGVRQRNAPYHSLDRTVRRRLV